MIPWLKALFYDENSFNNFVRVALFVGGEVLSGVVPNTEAWYAGKVISALSLAIKAGDKNVPVGGA